MVKPIPILLIAKSAIKLKLDISKVGANSILFALHISSNNSRLLLGNFCNISGYFLISLPLIILPRKSAYLLPATKQSVVSKIFVTSNKLDFEIGKLVIDKSTCVFKR